MGRKIPGRTRRGASRRLRRAGFSVIELLIVVAITSIGFVALLDLQVSSIKGLSYPAQLTAAVNLGEHFLQTLRMEAIEWTPQSSWDDPNLRYLSTMNQNANPNDPNAWQIGTGEIGAPDFFVDQAGSDGVYDVGLLREFPARENPRFCLHYRLSFTNASQRLIRAEVRVMWLRNEARFQKFKNCPLEMAEPQWRSVVQSITLTDQIMINTFI